MHLLLSHVVPTHDGGEADISVSPSYCTCDLVTWGVWHTGAPMQFSFLQDKIQRVPFITQHESRSNNVSQKFYKSESMNER